MSARREALALARELRARAELLDEDEWFAGGDRLTPVGPIPPRSDQAPELPRSRRERGSPDNSEVETATASVAVDLAALADLSAEVASCRLCPLGSQRLNPAFGVGSPSARVMFVGEGPGFEEDRQGEPFVGKAGQLLDKILASIGLSRRVVYIANVVKCHPMVDPSSPDKRGNDRPPSLEEMEACRHFLDRQLALIRPRFLVTLGATAARALLRTQTGITRLRGKWYEYGGGVRLLPTYHPAALLRNPELKRDAWNDMKLLRAALEETPASPLVEETP